MNTRKKYFFIIFFITLKMISQSTELNTTKLPTFIPPSPTAYDLGKFGQESVGLCTGTPNVSGPLYNYKVGNINVPISLNYSSNGIKVDQMETNVGLGWSLNSGGVITRILKDNDDIHSIFKTIPSESINLAFIKDASEISTNTEQDVFSFNFLGKTGKFVFKPDGSIMQISQEKIKIEFIIGIDFDSSFIITDIDGKQYIFKDKENTKYTSTNQPKSISFISSWYLTEIKDNNVNVKFEYDTYSQYYQTGTVQKSYKLADGYYGNSCEVPVNEYTDFTNNFSFENIKILRRISSSNVPNEEVLFISSKINEDGKQFPTMKISTISIKSISLVENIVFKYKMTLNDRVFLESITFKDPNKKYQFEYLQPETLCKRLSFSQDEFGYFNGADNTELIPQLNCTETQFGINGKANRNVVPNNSAVGILKKINYPTKGFTEFEYENNDFYDGNSQHTTERIIEEEITKNNSTLMGATGTALKYEFLFRTNNIVPCTGAVLEASIEREDGTCNYNADNDHIGNRLFCTFTIYNITTGTNLDIINLDTVDITGVIKTLALSPFCDYKLTVSSPSCLISNFKLSLSEFTQTIENKLTGGVRVRNKIENDGIKNQITRYYYAQKENLNTSTGVPGTKAYYYKIEERDGSARTVDPLLTITSCTGIFLYRVLESSSLVSLFGTGNNNIYYEYVTESFGGDNFENGGIEHFYQLYSNTFGEIMFGNQLSNNSFNNDGELVNGKEIEKIFFAKKHDGLFRKIKSVHSKYDTYPNSLISIDNYIVSDRYGKKYPDPIIEDFSVEKYKIFSNWSYLSETKELDYDFDEKKYLEKTTQYFYDNPDHMQLSRISTKSSIGDTIETRYSYAQDLPNEPFASDLILKNMIGIPLKTEIYRNNQKISEEKTQYGNDTSTNNILLAKNVYAAKFPNSLTALPFPVNGQLEKKLTYNQYDDKGNVLQFTTENGTPVTIIWGYNKTQVIAKIENTTYDQIVSRVPILQSLSDVDNDNCVSATCKEQLLRDELSILRNSLPSNTLVTTYTYNPLIGVTSITDPKGLISYYEYDSFNRLKFVKDQDLNVLQRYCYNYKGQQINCSDISSTSVITYNNVSKSGTYTKNSCAIGGVGSSVTYNVAPGAYTSTISQADADAKAQTDVTTNGQIYANTNETCTFTSVAKSGTYTKNSCAAGGIGSSVTYNVAAGAYTSLISQADADGKAQANVTTNGQTYANTNGTCTFTSVAKSGIYTKNSCAAGGVGSSVTYNVAAGAYTSLLSQVDADAKAQTDVTNNGQTYANTNGTCTFTSVAKSGIYTKNSCAVGGVGSSVTYTVAAGTYTSLISQADANAKAQANVTANGQIFANTNGTCTFTSIAKSGTYTKNSCAVGGVGSSVTYTVAAGTYTSLISQADADAKAQANVTANGQTFANTNGTCTFTSIAKSGTYTKNSCAVGGVGSSVTYTVAAGTYNSLISQADADAKAQANVTANGQTFANTNGTCTFTSIAKSGTYTKNSCAVGGVGSSVTYTVLAGAYASLISQADADAKAQANVTANGQTFANTNGTCTFTSIAKSGTYTKNSCAVGGAGSSVTYTVAAGTYTSLISQADADAKAQTDVTNNGQTFANINGTCTFTSIAKSGTYTKNDCISGTVGSQVTYLVAAGAYTSTISQADADNKAQSQIYANGQNYANANGTCGDVASFTYDYTFDSNLRTINIYVYSSSSFHNGATFNLKIYFLNSMGLTLNVDKSVVLPAGQTSSMAVFSLPAVEIVDLLLLELIKN